MARPEYRKKKGITGAGPEGVKEDPEVVRTNAAVPTAARQGRTCPCGRSFRTRAPFPVPCSACVQAAEPSPKAEGEAAGGALPAFDDPHPSRPTCTGHSPDPSLDPASPSREAPGGIGPADGGAGSFRYLLRLWHPARGSVLPELPDELGRVISRESVGRVSF